MEKRKPRVFTLIAGIVNLVCAALTMFGAAYRLLVLMRWIGIDAIFTTMGLACIFVGMLGIVVLVLAILTMVKAKRGTAITLFVFDVLLTLLCVYVIMGGLEIIIAVTLGLYVLGAVFLMIDIPKKAYAKVTKEESEVASENQPSQEKLAEKLSELKAMKENGTISEEEYKALREKALEKYCK